MYCSLLPVREEGEVSLPAAVAAFMDKMAAEAAVKAGTQQVSRTADCGALLAADGKGHGLRGQQTSASYHPAVTAACYLHMRKPASVLTMCAGS